MGVYPPGIANFSVRESRLTTSSANLVVDWILDSSPFVVPPASPNNNAAEVWAYSEVQVAEGYAGSPARVIRLPQPSYAGRGHDLCVLGSGHLVVATSEPSGGNGNESWFLVPPGADGVLTQEECPRIRCGQLFANSAYATGGAKMCADMGGGNILLGSNGGWKMVTVDAWSMTDPELEALPLWSYNGNGSISGIMTWDHCRVPGTQTIRFNGDNRFFDIDFGVAPGVINGTTVPGGDGLQRIALGSNIGQSGWYGFLAVDAHGGTWKQRGYVPDIAYWSADTIASLPKLGNQAGANPPPDKVLTSPVFAAMDTHEDIFCCMDMLDDGSMLVASQNSNRFANAQVASAHKWRFSAQALAEGGEQMPELTVTLPNWTQPWALRVDPRRRLHPR
jgi:hypothetical protein